MNLEIQNIDDGATSLPVPLRIILVEDDAAIMDVYQTVLKKEKFEVKGFTSGQEAIRAIRELLLNPAEAPDLFLLDFILPDMSGAEILTEIKNNEQTKNKKVFILSNETNVESLLPEGIKADKVLLKADITPTQLVGIIKKDFNLS